MVLVAVVAVVTGTLKRWADALYRHNGNPLSPSLLSPRFDGRDGVHVAGRPVPVRIEYDFRFSEKYLPSGIPFRLRSEVKVTDIATGARLREYVFHRHLVSGVRERSDGKLEWGFIPPRPGRYRIWRELGYMDPFGRWRGLKGGYSTIDVVPAPIDGR